MKRILFDKGIEGLRTGMARKRRSGNREPNGRVSRKADDVRHRDAIETHNTMKTALDARMRVFGVTEGQARSQNAGSVLGRLFLCGQVSEDQLIAAQHYMADRNAYHRGILAPPDYREPRMEGLSEPTKSYEQFVADARERWSKVQATLEDVCRETNTGMPLKALDMIVVRDIEAPYAVGNLRVALNRLVRFYLIGARKAA